MTIQLNSEMEEKLNRLVASGRFRSIEEAVEAGLSTLEQDEAWLQYARERVEAGSRAAEAGDFASEEGVDELFARYGRKSA